MSTRPRRRLSELEGDHELHTALERMRAHHPHLWGVLLRLHLAPDVDRSKLEKWRRAPKDSQEKRWAADYDEAMGPWLGSYIRFRKSG